MQFFASAITTLQTLVIALGAGLGVWGVVNLLEGYGSDNPGANAHGWQRSNNKLDMTVPLLFRIIWGTLHVSAFTEIENQTRSRYNIFC